ncbi:phage tail protein [Ralstonia mojiangensis]|uniref:phage tail protein n=1 Tax=Ralstonia mojiangensis TaxID=2953895 RepID=UPI002090782E|nr:phage tail protein [Ralstonia mojiangensis]MCO5412845.1 tail fiber protein [Ralstonia mojiangensis]
MNLSLTWINLGTAPLGKDGDTQRTANDKTNTNMSAIAQAFFGLSDGVDGLKVKVQGLQDLITSLQYINSVAVGQISYFPRTTVPPYGWFKANGAAVSRVTYKELYAVIGTAFGAGDGSTTFNLPDLRAEFLRGWDDGRGVDAGRGLGTFQADDFRAHSHTVPNDIVFSGNGTAFPGGPYGVNFSGRFTGTSGGAETRPRNIAMLACIRYA